MEKIIRFNEWNEIQETLINLSHRWDDLSMASISRHTTKAGEMKNARAELPFYFVYRDNEIIILIIAALEPRDNLWPKGKPEFIQRMYVSVSYIIYRCKMSEKNCNENIICCVVSANFQWLFINSNNAMSRTLWVARSKQFMW